jgi:hypothetical protein
VSTRSEVITTNDRGHNVDRSADAFAYHAPDRMVKIGNVRWLDGLMARGSLPVDHSLAGVDISRDAEVSASVEPAHSSIPEALITRTGSRVTYIPASSGRPLGFLKATTVPDGRVVNISAGKP